MTFVRPFVFRYFFLAFNVFQWIAAGVIFFRFGYDATDLSAAVAMATMGLTLYLVFLVAGRKIKCVAIRQNKIVMAEAPLNIQFDWSEALSLQVIPMINVYRLRLKGRKKSIFFFPSRNNDEALKSLKNFIANAQAGNKHMESQPVEDYRRLAI